MIAPLHGVYPVISTPFTANDSIDTAALAREVEWLIGYGVQGITVAMVSEILRLSALERCALTEELCALLPPGIGLIVSVGAESTKVAVELADHAQRVGATAVMAIPPLSVILDEEELLRYYFCIIEAAGVPLVVQDASGYVGQPLSISLQARLLRELGESCVYFKPEAQPIGQRVSELRDATEAQAKIFEGSGGLALADTYMRGVVGTMPGPEIPWAIVRLWQALERGDRDRAYAITCAMAPLKLLQSSLDSYIAIEKYLLVAQSVFSNARMRGPVGYRLDGETEAQVDRLLAGLRIAASIAKEELTMPSST